MLAIKGAKRDAAGNVIPGQMNIGGGGLCFCANKDIIFTFRQDYQTRICYVCVILSPQSLVSPVSEQSKFFHMLGQLGNRVYTLDTNLLRHDYVDFYDLVLKAWGRTTPMVNGLVGLQRPRTRFLDNKMFVFGETSAGDHSAEVYDPESDQWELINYRSGMAVPHMIAGPIVFLGDPDSEYVGEDDPVMVDDVESTASTESVNDEDELDGDNGYMLLDLFQDDITSSSSEDDGISSDMSVSSVDSNSDFNIVSGEYIALDPDTCEWQGFGDEKAKVTIMDHSSPVEFGNLSVVFGWVGRDPNTKLIIYDRDEHKVSVADIDLADGGIGYFLLPRSDKLLLYPSGGKSWAVKFDDLTARIDVPNWKISDIALAQDYLLQEHFFAAVVEES